ncbi:hypothetical protein [Pantoea eucalypti]|uniref:hypothetical protein n=1 Tax=Pantoea eucalypti TaxID=470933 RepID=UPI000998EB6E|nr:hypothetical protein [Pantoea eucalypti]SKA00350.1 hypothetical protein SAMN03097723_2749 [Pantoea eucalypti]
MQTLYSIFDLDQLYLPTSVIEAVHQHLTIPFESPEHAQDFWLSTHTVLWQLDADDAIPNAALIQTALQYPEFVLHLKGGWYLLLAIVCDNGQGVYLVFPETTVITELHNLIEALNHE